jgi:hypothetical protein
MGAPLYSGLPCAQSYAEASSAASEAELKLKRILYRAVVELSYIQEIACEFVPKKHHDLIASAEGAEIVSEGMKLLGVAELSAEVFP